MRNKARLKFLLADWGPEKFRQILENEYLGFPLPDGPAAPKPSAGRPRRRPRAEGRQVLHRRRPAVGRVSGTTLTALADLAEEHGSSRLRTTPHQKLVVLDIAEERVEPLVTGLDAIGLSARPSLFRRGTIACTGIEFCKLAIVETKVNAARAIEQLEQRLGALEPEIGRPITLHVNGCPNSCARIQTADIGLKGQLVHDRRRAGARLPGAPRRRAGERRPRGGRPRPHRARPEGHRRRHRRLRRARGPALPRRPRGRGRDVRDVGAPRRRGGAGQ